MRETVDADKAAARDRHFFVAIPPDIIRIHQPSSKEAINQIPKVISPYQQDSPHCVNMRNGFGLVIACEHKITSWVCILT